MSECLVEVCQIDQVIPHTNADKLEIAVIKGWQCVVPKKQFCESDKVVYFPPDTCLPEDVATKLGVIQYLGKGGRIRSIKLRGEPSFGLVIKLEDQSLEIGTDVSKEYGATKYEPPPKFTHGGQNKRYRKPKSWLGRFIQKYTWKLFNIKRGSAEEIPEMPRYTDIENLRNHNKVFEDGEQVSVSEKIHGSNVRVALINGVEHAGSHNIRRLRPEKPMTLMRAIKRTLRITEEPSYGEEIRNDYYWHPWSIPEVRNMLQALSAKYSEVVLYGEVYGKVQELTYGLPNDIAFRAFDLMLNGQYVDAELFYNTCAQFGVPTVPELYRGAFSMEKVRELAQGKTTINDAGHMKEGVVIRPILERQHRRVGRVILKYIGDEYLCSKGYNENKDV